MRPVHITDLDRVVRAVLPLSGIERSDRLRDIVASADAADRYRKRTGRPHAFYGNGSLGGAVSEAVCLINYCNADYRACLIEVLIAIDARLPHQKP